MSTKRPTPRVFLIRHGETEWSLNGRHTGRTDIPLTDRGVSQISSRAGKAIGPGKLIDPAHIEYAFISPRQRASKTFELLFAKWDYGEYEGLKPAEIQEVKPGFLIWRDGCPSGESPEEITARIDGVIEKVRTVHKKYFEEGIGKRDVVIVAHGPFSARSWPWFWTKDSD
ncbi:Phosphoglycerate mutase family [Rhizoctonia solani]|uniref:Phosphoglycerate mutase family n=1 Tax=Rhizoctonia solani TaxID=456999 RepID=A0A8H7IIZ8_9AGAM|nr:Phosphoglycerate mutase family [Rhizoctonia solani]